MGGIYTILPIKVAFEALQGAGLGPAVNLGPAPVGHKLTRTLRRLALVPFYSRGPRKLEPLAAPLGWVPFHHTHKEVPTWQLPLFPAEGLFSSFFFGVAKDLYRELGTVTATPDEAPPGIRVLPSGSRLKPPAI